MKLLGYKLMGILIFMTFFSSCTSDDDDTDSYIPEEFEETIATYISSNGEYSILAEALLKTDLLDEFDSNANYTVFVPNNTAFSAYLDGSTIAEMETGALKQLLLNHVFREIVTAEELEDGYYKNLATYADTTKNLSTYIENDNDIITINGGESAAGGADITQSNIGVSNGIIHKVNAVIDLPTVLTFAAADNNFSLFESAIASGSTSALYETLEGEGPFTFFVPSNSAVIDLLFELEITDINNISTLFLTAIVSNHIIYGENTQTSEMTSGTLNTLGGSVIYDSSNMTLTDSNGRVSTIIEANIQARNGVLHTLDKFILPPM